MPGFNEMNTRSPNEIVCKQLAARRDRFVVGGLGSAGMAALTSGSPVGSFFLYVTFGFFAAAYFTNVMRKKKAEVSVF